MTIPTNAALGRDIHVVERVLHGDAEVFRVLVERYRQDALAHALAMVGRWETAEDITDDAFLATFHGLAEIKDRSKFRLFLFRILRAQLAGPAARVTAEAGGEDATQHLQDAVRGITRPDGSILLKGLVALEPSLREALSLTYVAQLPLEEAMAVAGVSSTELLARLDQARAALAPGASAEFTGDAEEDDLVPPVLLPMEEGGKE